MGLDALLALDAQLLLDLDFDGQAVGVPTCLAENAAAAHGLVAADGVLEGAGQDMVDAGEAVGGGRTLVEDEGLPLGPSLQGGGQQVVLLPALEDLPFDAVRVLEPLPSQRLEHRRNSIGARGPKARGGAPSRFTQKSEGRGVSWRGGARGFCS